MNQKHNLPNHRQKKFLFLIGQISPNHFHWKKTEDIINRGGGLLMMKLWNSTKDEGLDTSDVTVRIDGKICKFSPGEEILLKPGESITLEPLVYHMFTAKDGKVLAWEVSAVNDDVYDNRFYEPQARFTNIDEDEPAKYLLCCEYPNAR